MKVRCIDATAVRHLVNEGDIYNAYHSLFSESTYRIICDDGLLHNLSKTRFEVIVPHAVIDNQ